MKESAAKNGIFPIICRDLLVDTILAPACFIEQLSRQHFKVQPLFLSVDSSLTDLRRDSLVLPIYARGFLYKKWCQSLWIGCNLKYNRRKRPRNVREDLRVVVFEFETRFLQRHYHLLGDTHAQTNSLIIGSRRFKETWRVTFTSSIVIRETMHRASTPRKT